MKPYLLAILSIFLMTLSLQAQTPEKLNYQGIARNDDGVPMTDQLLGIRVKILDGNNLVYMETHHPTTNNYGLYTLAIGDGTPLSGQLSDVNWSTGNKYINIAIDPNGGTGYNDVGTTELLSVPYALYAKNSGSAGGGPGDDWGSQIAETNTTLDGDGTTGNELGLADNAVTTAKINDNAITSPKIDQMSATNGQVLKWDGSAWNPADDDTGSGSGTGDDWGSQVAQTSERLSGDGTPANPLDIATQGATNGQVLKFDGTNWVPGTDDSGSSGTTYTAGDGISISGSDEISADLGTDIATSELQDAAVTSAKVNDAAINTAKLDNAAVTGDKIDQLSATNGQVLKWNGTTWEAADDETGTGSGTGDDWGTQVVEADATLDGDGTAGNELGLADNAVTSAKVNNDAINTDKLNDAAVTGEKIDQMGATNDQVLTWDGTTWAPDDVNGDDWGSQTAETNASLTGNGTTGDELGLAKNGATDGQILSWDDTNSNWTPTDPTSGNAFFEADADQINYTDTDNFGKDLLVNTEDIDYVNTGDPEYKMMFLPSKEGAFRAGVINDILSSGEEWDFNNIGNASTAFGINTKASGNYSTAIGFFTEASSVGSTAMGDVTEASGNYSTAMGSFTKASGWYSTAMGENTEAPSYAETAIGSNNTEYTPTSTTDFETADRQFTVGIGEDNSNKADGFMVMKSGLVTAPEMSTTMIDNNQDALVTKEYLDDNVNFFEADADQINYTDTDNFGKDLLFNTEEIDYTNTGDDEYKMLFLPSKNGAFRAGSIDDLYSSSGEQWNSDNIGNASTAFGRNTEASGDYSTAMGYKTEATKKYATAMGDDTEASGSRSTAMGGYTKASGSTSTAMGSDTKASGSTSTAMGDQTEASGLVSTAMGAGTHASGDYSVAMGGGSQASGKESTAMGRGTEASGSQSTAMGYSTEASGNYSTAMGEDTKATGENSTAMGYKTEASKKYATTMGYDTKAWKKYATAMGQETEASGLTSTAMGYNTKASGSESTAMGSYTEASEASSTAMGYNTKASGIQSTAMGVNTEASGSYSTAMGSFTEASDASSTAMGYGTEASGNFSIAMGNNSIAAANNSTVIGKNIQLTDAATGSMFLGDAKRTGNDVWGKTGENRFYAVFDNGYVLNTNGDTNSSYGVVLSHNDNSWSTASDRNKKENVKLADGGYFLESIKKMKIGSWNYIGQDPEEYRHWGPMAQDMYKYFGHDGIGTIGNDTTIATADIDGVMMISIQQLARENDSLKTQNKDLEVEMATLEQEMQDQKQAMKDQKQLLEAKIENYAEEKQVLKAKVENVDQARGKMEQRLSKLENSIKQEDTPAEKTPSPTPLEADASDRARLSALEKED